MTKYRVFQAKLHPERDAQRIAWLDAQEAGATFLVRRWIDAEMGSTRTERTQGPIIDLLAIRQVIETALDERLAGALVPAAQTQSEDPTLTSKLDAMF